MDKVKQFLKDCGYFFVATVEGDQPRVRPFGAINEYEGKLYIITNGTKKVSHQMKANPKIEISGFFKGEWIRVSGKVILDERREAREDMIKNYPQLSNMYDADDGIMEVFYIVDGVATIESM